MNLVDLTGAGGVTLILLAYFLNVLDKLDNKSAAYLTMNIVGAALACYSSILLESIPFTVLEATWVVVSLIALIFRKKN